MHSCLAAQTLSVLETQWLGQHTPWRGTYCVWGSVFNQSYTWPCVLSVICDLSSPMPDCTGRSSLHLIRASDDKILREPQQTVLSIYSIQLYLWNVTLIHQEDISMISSYVCKISLQEIINHHFVLKNSLWIIPQHLKKKRRGKSAPSL